MKFSQSSATIWFSMNWPWLLPKIMQTGSPSSGLLSAQARPSG